MLISIYHSIHLIGDESLTAQESHVEVAFVAIQNYRQFFEFCKINGSARIHISVNLEERIMLHPPYFNRHN